MRRSSPAPSPSMSSRLRMTSSAIKTRHRSVKEKCGVFFGGGGGGGMEMYITSNKLLYFDS